MSASTIILEYICPCAGMIIANIMFSAPFRDLQNAVKIGNIGNLNCTPWAFMLGNCFGWVLYGILRRNFWVYFANAPGFLMSVWLNLGACKLLYQKHHANQMRSSLIQYLQQQNQQQQNQGEEDEDDDMKKKSLTGPFRLSVEQDSAAIIRPLEHENDDNKSPSSIPVATVTALQSAATTTKDWAKIVWQVTSQTTPAPTPHERLVVVVAAIWMAIASFVGFAGSTNLISWNDSSNNNYRTSATTVATQVVGYLVNLNLVFFYGAPLSTIWTVLKQRNTATIHIPTLVTNTLNGSFWLAYGLAVGDAFIYVPNGLGAALGGIQVALLLLFPRGKDKDDDNDIVDTDGSLSGEEKPNKKESNLEDPESPAMTCTTTDGAALRKVVDTTNR
jgi:solute carrier family 50 (sugar transporter)